MEIEKKKYQKKKKKGFQLLQILLVTERLKLTQPLHDIINNNYKCYCTEKRAEWECMSKGRKDLLGILE